MIKAVLFDLDGTLVDFKLKVVELKQELLTVLREMNLVLDERFLSEPIQVIFEEAERVVLAESQGEFLDRVLGSMRSIIDRYEIEGFRDTSLRDEAHRILNWLKSKKLKLALVTNDGSKATDYVLGKFGLRNYWDSIVTRDDVKKWKPHPEPLLKASRLLEVEPHSCLFVGDSRIDVRAAKASGIKIASLTWGIHSPEQLRVEGPDYIISSLSELSHVVNGELGENR